MTGAVTPSSAIALVTGSNKGIGYHVAAQLAELGMTVLVAARDARRRSEAVEALRSTGRDVHPVALDVTDSATIQAAAKRIDDLFGRLDVLVNNAGIAAVGPDSFHEPPPSSAQLDVIRKVFEVNVFGVIAVTNAMLPLLRRSSAARIVNMSSAAGSLTLMSDVDGPMGAVLPSAGYISSKTALNSLTVQYAKELREDNILVNTVSPGYCSTDMNNQGRLPNVTPTERTAAQGAAIAVRLATLGPDGPTGGFFDDDGPVPW